MKTGPACVLPLAVSFAALTACQSAPANTGDHATASPAPRVTPATSSTPTEPVSPLSDPGQPTTSTPGKVTVRSIAGRYRAGQPITIAVANGLDQPIFSNDFRTDCSIVLLQRRRETWADIAGCAQGRPPATFGIGPSHMRTVIINPNSINFDISTELLSAGTYRAAYRYRFDPTSSAEDSEVTYSQPFTIE